MKRFMTISSCPGGVVTSPRGWIKQSTSLLLLVFLLAAAEICLAIPCPGPPPADQDFLDGSVNACIELSFTVPAVPADQRKQGGERDISGWGSLVLTFDREIDGGSFVFDPDCPNPLDGMLSPDRKSILLSPVLATPPIRYGLGATGTPSPSGNGNFGMFEVTIMYDIDGGVPQLMLESAPINGTSVSWWQSKGTDFVFNPKSAATPRNYDMALPEPSTLPLLGLGALALAFCTRRRRGERHGVSC